MHYRDIPVLSGGGRLGHFDEMRRDRLGMMKRVARERYDMVRIEVFPAGVCLANSPASLYQVLVEKADAFRKSPVLRSVLYPLAGEGLFTSEGELWRRQRKLMSPIFRYKNLGHFAACMSSCAEHALSDWQDDSVVDVARETTRITMSVAGKTLFDADTFDEADEIGHALTVALGWANLQTRSPLLLLQARIKTLLDTRRFPSSLERWREALSRRLESPLALPTKDTREMRAALALLDGRVAKM
ncbi:MAG TPA: cytochrome P450, partial [Polyangiaceae bacterium]|nr:cytochrome P450 [Polyangiaceae bacterium]